MQQQKVLVKVSLCLMAFFVTNLAFSQTSESTRFAQGSGDDTIKALLSEVRQLRLTLQKSNLNGYRMQFMVERIRMQQARVDKITNTLEDLRGELSAMQVSVPQQTEQIREVETRLKQESDAEQRAQLESQLRELKYSVDEQKQRADQLRDRESQVSAQLREEKMKLDELFDKINTVEREMEQEIEGLKPSQKRPND